MKNIIKKINIMAVGVLSMLVFSQSAMANENSIPKVDLTEKVENENPFAKISLTKKVVAKKTPGTKCGS